MLFSAEINREICPFLLEWATSENEVLSADIQEYADDISQGERYDAEAQYGIYGPYFNAAGAYVYGYQGKA